MPLLQREENPLMDVIKKPVPDEVQKKDGWPINIGKITENTRIYDSNLNVVVPYGVNTNKWVMGSFSIGETFSFDGQKYYVDDKGNYVLTPASPVIPKGSLAVVYTTDVKVGYSSGLWAGAVQVVNSPDKGAVGTYFIYDGIRVGPDRTGLYARHLSCGIVDASELMETYLIRYVGLYKDHFFEDLDGNKFNFSPQNLMNPAMFFHEFMPNDRSRLYLNFVIETTDGKEIKCNSFLACKDGRVFAFVPSSDKKDESKSWKWVHINRPVKEFRFLDKSERPAEISTSVTEEKQKKEYSVEFNPNEISIKSQLPIQLEIFNSVGGKVKEEIVDGSAAVNIESLPRGVYFLRINDGSKQEVMPFIKE